MSIRIAMIGAGSIGFTRRSCLVCVFAENLPGERDFEAPADIFIAGVIERAIDMNSGFQSGNLPFVLCFAARLIRFVEQQIPPGVEGVHFEFVIVESIAIRIDEDLEIIVLKNH